MYKPLPLEAIELNQPVPVNVWDTKGILLLRKGEPITSEQHRGHLMLHGPMVRESDWQAWAYSYTTALDRMVRGNQSLSRIAGLTQMVEVRNAAANEDAHLAEAWPDLHATLATLLHQGAEAAQFLERLDRLARRAQALWRRQPDASLIVLLQLLFDARAGYTATHALLSAGLCALVAPSAGLPEAEQDSLFRAALTMNIGMARVHDALARQDGALTEAQQRIVHEHPLVGAQVLRDLGVDDALWLRLVEEHHERADGGGYPTGKKVSDLPQRLLRMADGYVACISPRRDRGGGQHAPQVAKELLIGPDQRPDALGALFIKHIGLYPPGTYVRLASEELAVVARRGAKPNAPVVLAITGRQGLPLGVPALRDTQERAFEVSSSVLPGDVRVVVQVQRLLERL